MFKLGEFYSERMNATFLNDQGKAKTMIMGSYGIGVSRTVAAIVEQYHDERGITWPANIAPYKVHLLSMNPKKQEQKDLAEEIYGMLLEAGIEVLYDDRKERAGVKFADSDLFGVPLRITVGKRAPEAVVELKERATGEQKDLETNEIIDYVKNWYQA